MRYELFLALRNLRSRRRRRLARVTALIAIVGIAAGVATLITALAIGNGFRHEMQDKILRGNSHLTVVRKDGRNFDHRELSSRLSNIQGVTSLAATTYDGAIIIGPTSSTYTILRGIDKDSESARHEIRNWLVDGSLESLFDVSEEALPAVVLGAELAGKIGVKTGDQAEIISAHAGSTSSGSRRRVYVAGIFRSGLFEYDATWIYLPVETANTFAGSSHAGTVLGVQVNDIYEVKPIAAKIRAALGESFTVVDWQEANRPLFTALAVERRMAAIVIALIILIASLNITTSLILVVLDRRRDIAILNAMGSTPNSIMSIFVLDGAIIGFLGAVSGMLIAGIVVFFANRYQLISLPADVYSISNVPLHLNSSDVILAALVALMLSVIATIYPARAAARLRPAEVFRQ